MTEPKDMTMCVRVSAQMAKAVMQAMQLSGCTVRAKWVRDAILDKLMAGKRDGHEE